MTKSLLLLINPPTGLVPGARPSNYSYLVTVKLGTPVFFPKLHIGHHWPIVFYLSAMLKYIGKFNLWGQMFVILRIK